MVSRSISKCCSVSATSDATVQHFADVVVAAAVDSLLTVTALSLAGPEESAVG